MSNGFHNFWQPFIRVFQALCISHYSVFRHNDSKSKIFLAYFVVITLCNMVALVVSIRGGRFNREDFVFVDGETKFKGSPLMYYINALSIFSSLVIHSTIALEVIFVGKQENEICEKLKLIDDIFSTKLSHMVNYKIFRIRYFKIVGIFVIAIILAISCAFSPLPEVYYDKFFMTPLMLIGVIISRARWCQIALYLNIIADTLDELQHLLKRQQIQSYQQTNEETRGTFDPERLRYIREIYSDMWFIVSLMSDCFGWTLLTFLIKITLESINGSYWIYINWNLYGSTALYARKNYIKLYIMNSF